VTQAIPTALETGRTAARRHAWRQAYELLHGADDGASLEAEDL
jgi:hypothetical protein